MIEKISKYGIAKCFQVFKSRIRKKFFLKLHSNQLHSSIELSDPVEKVINSKRFLSLTPKFKDSSDQSGADQSGAEADDIMENKFVIFGSKLAFKDIKWHDDITAKVFNRSFDVKIPWELSRFNFLYVLGKKYQSTANEKYAKKFVFLFNDWHSKNPFLKGINWSCAMEVSIRSINLIWGYHFFKDSEQISTEFWSKFSNSLQQHAHYLKNNWEIFLHNNNHYIADLLGYYYLCLLFKKNKSFYKQALWCHKKLLTEFFKQIQPDGTSYEGSTNYHKLVSEMYLHFYTLSEEHDIKLPKKFKDQFEKMIQFLKDCTDHGNNLVQIGDNDSGKIVTGLSLKQTNKEISRHYSNFGISIIKTNTDWSVTDQSVTDQSGNKKLCNWHITFRHPTYKNQPTGHFHIDDLSITLSLNDNPILVDPGTYVYTANTEKRNQLRSSKPHNTFHLNLDEKTQNLFSINKKQQSDSSYIEHKKDLITILNHHNRYSHLGLIANRSLNFSNKMQALEITDWWEGFANSESRLIDTTSNWILTFHPRITIEKSRVPNLWNLSSNNKILACLKSSLNFNIGKGLYSEGYNQIESTMQLIASEYPEYGKKHSLIIQAMH